MEPSVDLKQGSEAARQQDGADEENERQRDFGAHEGAPHEAFRLTRNKMSVTPPKYINKARIGDLKRRNEAREDAGEQPHSQSESQHRHVDGDFGQTRNIPGVENLEQLDRAYGQQQTRPCAEEPQHERFGQKLADQTTSPRTECRADGRLSPACGGASQEKMGQIHGSNQQNEPHSRQQDPERSTELSARHPFTRGLDEKAHGFFPKLG